MHARIEKPRDLYEEAWDSNERGGATVGCISVRTEGGRGGYSKTPSQVEQDKEEDADDQAMGNQPPFHPFSQAKILQTRLFNHTIYHLNQTPLL